MTELALKYRPKTPDGFVGAQQQTAARVLQAAATSGTPYQKVLLTGNSGLGKTSLALYYADLLDAEVHLINCGVSGGKANVEAIIGSFQMGSLSNQYKFYIFDEIHNLTDSAQEALLADTEERLPPHVIIVGTSTMPHKLKGTLISRFKSYHVELRLPTEAELKRHMLAIFEQEHITIDLHATEGRVVTPDGVVISPDYAKAVFERGEGNIRTIVNLIEQVLNGLFDVDNITDLSTTDFDVVRAIYSADKQVFTHTITDYNAVTIGLCNYALGVLKRNDASTRIGARAVHVLRTFGNGLNKNVPAHVAFWHLVASL